jgi:two-component system response regulator AtoC
MTKPNDNKHVLLVDDEEGLRFSLTVLLSKKGFKVSAAENGQVALLALQSLAPDFVLCDLRMPEMDGMTFLQRALAAGFRKPIIMMSAYAQVEEAVAAMRMGAFDYVSKPFKKEEILKVLGRAAEIQDLRAENASLREAARAAADRELLTDDPRMHELLALVRKIAAFKTTVLIAGESGSGKELIARSIHRNSPRADAPFVAINCGAIPENLLESELFGHAKGAFTDAVAAKAGLLTASSGGTLFLDEIGELPLRLQVKMLRVLQDQRLRPLGANEEIAVDLRVVAATARNLEESVAQGLFREDLFYRLNVFHLRVPPLRDRKGDLPLLTRHFISKFTRQHGLPGLEIGPEALRILEAYPWPGNVRELENAVERAVLVAAGPVIAPEDLPERVRRPSAPSEPAIEDLSIKRNVRDLERRLIVAALERTLGNKSKAAKLLDLSFRALLYKIKEFGLQIESAANGDEPPE